MSSLVDVRVGMGPIAVRAAALSALVPIGAVAYVLWKVLEEGDHTLDQDEFALWVRGVGFVAVCVAGVGLWFWRATRVRLAFGVGVGLTFVACMTGLLVEVLNSTT